MKYYELASAMFHPSVVTFLVFLTVIIYLHIPLYNLLIVTIFFSLIPFLIVFIMLKLRMVTDIYVTKREQRIIPMIIATISYILGILLLDSHFIKIVAIIYLINTLIILLITLFYKISVHVSTTVGGITLIVYTLGPYLLPAFLFGVLISYVRYKMKAHTLSQVVTAWIFAPLSYIELYLAFHNLLYVRT